MNSHEQSDQPINVIPTEPTGKKPVALAVTLILLVISMIFVILFATTTIGNKQQNQVDTGNQIVNSLKQLNNQLGYTEQSLDYVLNHAKMWNDDKAMLLVQTGYLLEGVKEELSILLEIAANPEHEEHIEASSELVEQWYTLYAPIFAAEHKAVQLDEKQLVQLQALKATITSLHQNVQQFNFKQEGNRSAMIRLSNGFGWVELAEQMKQALEAE